MLHASTILFLTSLVRRRSSGESSTVSGLQHNLCQRLLFAALIRLACCFAIHGVAWADLLFRNAVTPTAALRAAASKHCSWHCLPSATMVQSRTTETAWRLSQLPRLTALVLFLLASWCQHHHMLASAETCFCIITLPGYTLSFTNCTNASRKIMGCPGPVKDSLPNATIMLNVTGVKTALAVGADVNATSSHAYIRGLTPLQVALLTTSEPVWHIYTEPVYLVLKALLDAGADPNAPYPQGTYLGHQYYAGMTPLQYVAHDGRIKLVRLLIKAGADVNARGRGGRTALHEAAMCPLDVYAGEQLQIPPPALQGGDYNEVMWLLLKAGVDIHACDDEGHTPYQLTPDYTTGCQGTAGLPPTCALVCEAARGSQGYYHNYGLDYNTSEPVRKGDCCADPDVDQLSTNGLNYSYCCLAHNGFLTTN